MRLKISKSKNASSLYVIKDVTLNGKRTTKIDERIEAHFITCFISLMIYRLLEKRLNSEFTSKTIIQNLRDMNFLEAQGEGSFLRKHV